MIPVRLALGACLSATLLAPVPADAAIAAETNANSGALRYTGAIAGAGVTGGWTREGDGVRLAGGAWNNRVATLELDRTGNPKLAFRGVDPGITHCTGAG